MADDGGVERGSPTARGGRLIGAKRRRDATPRAPHPPDLPRPVASALRRALRTGWWERRDRRVRRKPKRSADTYGSILRRSADDKDAA